jgi:mRNA degradation ribonuclease J1/J2
MNSPHLEAEKAALLAQIKAIYQSGEVASPHVRIEPDFLTPKSWILTHTMLPMKERHLGLHGSEKYHDWEARIQRREQIQELEIQLKLLQELIDRQTQAETLFVTQLPTIDYGDVVEYEGGQYRVQDVGFRFLRLVDQAGRVIRCEIEQAKLLIKAI